MFNISTSVLDFYYGRLLISELFQKHYIFYLHSSSWCVDYTIIKLPGSYRHLLCSLSINTINLKSGSCERQPMHPILKRILNWELINPTATAAEVKTVRWLQSKGRLYWKCTTWLINCQVAFLFFSFGSLLSIMNKFGHCMFTKPCHQIM